VNYSCARDRGAQDREIYLNSLGENDVVVGALTNYAAWKAFIEFQAVTLQNNYSIYKTIKRLNFNAEPSLESSLLLRSAVYALRLFFLFFLFFFFFCLFFVFFFLFLQRP
jgi:hypothetical protein